MDYRTFDEAVRDYCRHLGLSGHEQEYGELLVEGVYKTSTGIYSITSLLNMTPEMERKIRNLNRIMKSSPEGKKALEEHGLLGKEAVPVPLSRVDKEINPLYLLPSEKHPELRGAIESLTQAIVWEKEMEEKSKKERK